MKSSVRIRKTKGGTSVRATGPAARALFDVLTGGVDKKDKGLKGGSCNVTACQAPGAMYFNKSTRAYYCEDCAREINWPGGRADTMELYGVPLLCELDEAPE